ncbi:hypothetical protein PMAC_001770 [Pneumocystis sp. 'macacae']|nr:hypothetical protein PMAC_001770 [Pneumocystis sp. 'macacae']
MRLIPPQRPFTVPRTRCTQTESWLGMRSSSGRLSAYMLQNAKKRGVYIHKPSLFFVGVGALFSASATRTREKVVGSSELEENKWTDRFG